MPANLPLPLDGVRVVELATGVAGPFCGKLLAQFGAAVVKVEPAGGDPTRRWGPGEGALFLHLNGEKTLVGERDEALLAAADVLLVDERDDPDALRARWPRAVVTSFRPFGRRGPYAHFGATDIVLYAMGGPMLSTGVIEREPLKLAGNLAQCQWGSVGAVATLGALRRAEATGVGALVEVDGLQTQLGSIDRQLNHLLWYRWNGENVTRPPTAGQSILPYGYYPCADGHVAVIVVAAWLDRMLSVLADDELTARCANDAWMTDPEVPGLLEAALYNWLAERTKVQAMAEAQAARWPVMALNEPVDLLDDPHFAARGFFVERDGERVPGPPIRFSAVVDRDAPVTAAPASAAAAADPADPADPAALPLAGVRVLDLTVVWSGPYATMFLADLGAEVIRVDNPWVFPTVTRGNVPRPVPESLRGLGPLTGCYPAFDPGARPWNRAGNFIAHARTKASCTLDLRRPLGRETFLRLLDHADVVVENNSIDVLDKLGLGRDVLLRRNPRLVVVRMPSMGLDGPYRNHVGFGFHLESLAGSASLWGYRDGDRSLNNPVFPMDPAAGTVTAAATIAALRERDRSGTGVFVEVPQVEVVLQYVGEELIHAGRVRQPAPPLGNRHPTFAPQGAYPCRGEDRWVVLSVPDDEAWAGLRRALGDPAWAADDRFATAAGRRAHHDELDEHLAAWSRELDQLDAFRRLQTYGVPAGPVYDEAGRCVDEHLLAVDAFRANGSAEVPSTLVPDHLWRWDGPPLAWGPFSRLGAENDHVYRDILGMDDDEVAALAADGHLSLDYLRPDGTPW